MDDGEKERAVVNGLKEIVRVTSRRKGGKEKGGMRVIAAKFVSTGDGGTGLVGPREVDVDVVQDISEVSFIL